MANNEKLQCPKCGFIGIPNVKTTMVKTAHCSRCDVYIKNLTKGQKQKQKGNLRNG